MAVNAIAKHTTQSTGIPARTVAGVSVPMVSPWLREAMAHVAEPHPDIGIEPARIREGVRDEAAAALVAMEPVLRHATADEWMAFLRPLAALPNGPTRDAFAAKASAIAFALHDVPASVLTTNRQRDALRALRFWPSPHDLDAVLRPAINEIRRERRLLETVVNAPTVQASNSPTDAERASMAERARALVAELRGKAEVNARPSARARPLSQGQLRQAYERIGNSAAQMRIAAIDEDLQP